MKLLILLKAVHGRKMSFFLLLMNSTTDNYGNLYVLNNVLDGKKACLYKLKKFSKIQYSDGNFEKVLYRKDYTGTEDMPM